MLAEVNAGRITRPVKACCVHGHPLTVENTLWQRVRGKYHRRRVYPICKTCRLASWAEFAQRRREAAGDAEYAAKVQAAERRGQTAQQRGR